MKKSVSVSKFELFSIRTIIEDNNLDLLQQLLIQGEISLQYKDIYKNSLLHIAVSYHQYSICKYLIEEGIELNTTNIYHMTPLEQSIHMKFSRISELLRKNGAYYKNKLDSEQIIYGERDLYFKKLKLCFDNVSHFFSNSLQINFFHNTFQSHYFFPCSLFITKSNEFQHYISNFILSKELNLFKEENHLIETKENQNEFLFLPYCSLYNIKQLILIPIEVHTILIGYFFIWNEKIDIDIPIQSYKHMLKNIILGNYFPVLEYSLLNYNFNIKCSLIQDYLNEKMNQIKQTTLNYENHVSIMKFIENCISFWKEIKEDIYFKEFIFLVQYYKEILIPTHQCFKLHQFNQSLYERMVECRLIKDEPLRYPSYSYQYLIKFQLPNNTIKNSSKEENELSIFDYFNIIGNELKQKEVGELNILYQSFSIDTFSFQIYLDIKEILFQNRDIRETNVFGKKNNYEHTFFMFPKEINESIEFIFKKVNDYSSIYIKIYYLYICITQYIHPFLDGNGRISRLVFNFYLKKLGHTFLLHKKNKMIQWEEYKKSIVDK